VTGVDPLLQVALIGGAASVLCALIGLFGVIIPKIHHNTASLTEVREQVSNTHGSNLREDIDFIRDVVLDVRADVAWVRRDHLDLSKRVDRLEDA
jgi:hypothetical protein